MSHVVLAQHPALRRVGDVLFAVRYAPPIGAIGVFREDGARACSTVCTQSAIHLVLQQRGINGVACTVLAIGHQHTAEHVGIIGKVLGRGPQHVSRFLARARSTLPGVFGRGGPIHHERPALLVLRIVLVGTIELAVVVQIVEIRHPGGFRGPCHADFGDGRVIDGVLQRLSLRNVLKRSIGILSSGFQRLHLAEMDQIVGFPDVQLGAVTGGPRSPASVVATEHAQVGGKNVEFAGLRILGDERVAHTGGGFVAGENRFAAIEGIPLLGVVAARDVEVDFFGVALIVFDEMHHRVAIGIAVLELGDGNRHGASDLWNGLRSCRDGGGADLGCGSHIAGVVHRGDGFVSAGPCDAVFGIGRGNHGL